MNHYSMELIARQKIADWQREAQKDRLARNVSASRTPKRVLEPVRRLIGRLAPAT